MLILAPARLNSKDPVSKTASSEMHFPEQGRRFGKVPATQREDLNSDPWYHLEARSTCLLLALGMWRQVGSKTHWLTSLASGRLRVLGQVQRLLKDHAVLPPEGAYIDGVLSWWKVRRASKQPPTSTSNPLWGANPMTTASRLSHPLNNVTLGMNLGRGPVI